MGEGEATQNGSESAGSKRKVDTIELAKLKAQEFVARIVNDAEIKRPRLQDSAVSTPVAPLSAPSDIQKLPDLPKEISQSGPTPLETYPVSKYNFQGASKKMDIPNGKVGVIIGKSGETIKYLQFQSGARIQVAKDSEVDPYSQTRAVELIGTAEQISRAEELITDVIAKTDTGVSSSFASSGHNHFQPGAEEFVMKIPNHKVARVIGKGGETIKSMQSKSGARIQVIPLHLPLGDPSTERNVHINGTKEQIELAKGLVTEIISEMQQNYYGTGKWVPPTQPSMSQPGYAYTQPGAYPTPPPAYYGSYPPQPLGWDQSNLSAAPPQQSTETNYYGQQDQTGSAGSATNFSYGQTQTTNVNYEQGYSHQSQSYEQNIPAQVTQNETHSTSGYAQPNVSSQLEGTTPLSHVAPASSQPPPYQPLYGQSPATSAYGPPSYSNPLPPQSSYDQTGYTQSGYGVQPPVETPVQSQTPMSQPVYGQAGYPPQPSPIQSSYYQGTNVYGQTHPQVQVQPQPQLQQPMSQPVYGYTGYPPQQPPQSNYYQGTTVYGQTQLSQTQPQSQAQPQPQVYTAPVAYGAETNGSNSNATPTSATGSAVQEVVHSQS